MPREIKLTGSESSLLKAIGLSGTQVSGRALLERTDDMMEAEFLDTLTGLIEQGYVLANRVNLRTMEDAERAFLSVNQGEARDLRDAINPNRKRDEHRARRVRRS